MGVIPELIKAFSPHADAFFFMWLLSALGLTAFGVAIERFLALRVRTDYDSLELFDTLKHLIENRRLDEAYGICAAGGRRILPRILGAGIKKAMMTPHLVRGAMAEESTHMVSAMEHGMGLLVMFSNIATLIGLLGTVFGLITSFDAVANVSAVEKSSRLAAGISTAMNSTLVGLSISVLTIVVYAFLRSRVDAALQETDRYSAAILNLLDPPDVSKAPLRSLTRHREEEEAPDTDVTPMLNLMVMLIPFLLTSSEFIKMGTIEMKLPESDQAIVGEGGGGGGTPEQKTRLDLGVAITAKGFTVLSLFRPEDKSEIASLPLNQRPADIPVVEGAFDYAELNRRLADIKRNALLEIFRNTREEADPNASLFDLVKQYRVKFANAPSPYLDDVDNIKIVAEEKINYQTVVSVMDAARAVRLPTGKTTDNKPDSVTVPMFPFVSIAGGIIQ